MNILITGITGRVGANLASRLVQDGHHIRGLVWPRDPRTGKLQNLGVELVTGSITNVADVERAVMGMDVVYHLAAAFQGGGPFTEEEYFEINVRGTFNVLESTRKSKTLKHLVFSSTDALYRKYIPGGLSTPITEDMPRIPAGSYAMTKALGEELCNGYWTSYQLPVTILRFAMIFGAGEILQFPQFYLSKTRDTYAELQAHWTGEEHLVILKDKHGRSFKKHVSDVRDIIAGCVAALGKETVFGETIQLAAPRPFTWDEAVRHLSGQLNIKMIEANVQGTPTYYEFDLTRCRTLIGFEPQYDIIRTIDDAIRYEQGEDTGLLPT